MLKWMLPTLCLVSLLIVMGCDDDEDTDSQDTSADIATCVA